MIRSALVCVLLTACAAPRDPALERAIIKHKLTQPVATEEAPSEPPPPPPATAVTASTRPLKTYSGAELAQLFAAVPGTGARILASIETAQGTIECVLDDVRAPQTTANFVALALGRVAWRARDGGPEQTRPFYDGLKFHRVVEGFIIQAGDPNGRNAAPGWRIARETGANALLAEPGAIAMIDDGDATHGSQFFIVLKPNRTLAQRNAAFGSCNNLELVGAIANAEKKPRASGTSTEALHPVEIERIALRRTE